jgi:tight adherence protein C
MTSEILQNLATGPSLMMLTAAMMLIVGGVALIASGGRTNMQAVAKRVDRVRPARADARGAAAPSFEGSLLRLPARGLSAAAQREVIRRFSKLGVSPNRALTYFVLARFAAALALGVVIFLWVRTIPAFQASRLLLVVVPAMAAIAGWFVPLMLIGRSVKQRTKAVKSGLPDALELLVVCVEAGLSLEDGLERVVTELSRSQPALADELGLTLADLRILPSRDRALLNFAERIDIPNVRSVVTTLAQTLRYGTPLAQSLRVVAAEMRNDYLIELEERANRLPAYLTLPVILFLMPTIFLIVGGPAALRLFDAFRP